MENPHGDIGQAVPVIECQRSGISVEEFIRRNVDLLVESLSSLPPGNSLGPGPPMVLTTCCVQ